MSRASDYDYIQANIRGKLSNLLSEEFLLDCARSKDLESLLVAFNETPFSFLRDLYFQTADLKSCEKKLKENELAAIENIYKKTSGAVADFCKVLSLGYEIEKLKELLRLWFDRAVCKHSIDALTPYISRDKIIHDIPIDPILNAADFRQVVDFLKGLPYFELLNAVVDKIETDQTIYNAEMALDNYYFFSLNEAVSHLSSSDRGIAAHYVGTLIDIENLNRLVRLNSYFQFTKKELLSHLLPGGNLLSLHDPIFKEESNTIDWNSLFQKNFSNYFSDDYSLDHDNLLQILSHVEWLGKQIREHHVFKALSANPFSIGIIIAFFIRKKTEIRRIITLLNAKYYRLPYERVKDLL